jgi:hypothetical protein
MKYYVQQFITDKKVVYKQYIGFNASVNLVKTLMHCSGIKGSIFTFLRIIYP